MEEVEVKDNNLYEIIVSDYFATGEGRTIDILITRAYPLTCDYDENYKVKKISTSNSRAFREFVSFHGAWSAGVSKFITVENLLKDYKQYLPEYAINIIIQDRLNAPGNFNYCASFHINYS